MRMVLAVDGSPPSDRALQYVIGLRDQMRGLDVELVNVQPRMDTPNANLLLSAADLADYARDESARVLTPASAVLTAAGVEHRVHALVGPAAEEIVGLAARTGAAAIVVGTQARRALTGLLLGSVATRVIERSPVPVTVVR